jgi:hypothetical protein
MMQGARKIVSFCDGSSASVHPVHGVPKMRHPSSQQLYLLQPLRNTSANSSRPKNLPALQGQDF